MLPFAEAEDHDDDDDDDWVPPHHLRKKWNREARFLTSVARHRWRQAIEYAEREEDVSDEPWAEAGPGLGMGFDDEEF